MKSRVLHRPLQALLLALVLAPSVRADDVAPLRERTTVTIGGRAIAAEVARAPADRSRGLGGRGGLAPETGMVFPFEKAGRWGFWMKDMRFDIDIVWIRGGKIVDISPFVPAPRSGAPAGPMAMQTFEPREPADTVLEVVAGTARARGWAVGDTVGFDPPLR